MSDTSSNNSIPEPTASAVDYSLLPAVVQPPSDSATAISSTTKQTSTYTVAVFECNAVLTTDPDPDDDYHAFGSLRIGTANPMGTLAQNIAYMPPQKRGSTQQNEWHDISSLVHVSVGSESDGTLVYQKLNDGSLSAYAFNITVTNLGSQTATFDGTLTQDGKTYSFWGQWITDMDDSKTETVLDLPVPANVDLTQVSLQDLITLTPFDTTGLDQAQKFGDDLIFQLMLHALNNQTQQNFLPSLAPLDQNAAGILSDNQDCLHRMGVHVFAEDLKGADNIKDQDFAKHILYKYNLFIKMLQSPTAPSPPAQDPVVLYGWDRNSTDDMTLLDKLRQQYNDISMRTYQAGYLNFVPTWTRFFDAPDYWFKAYAAYLLSGEHLAQWTATLVDTPDIMGHLSSTDEVIMWGNKLSMLKANASADVKDSLDVSEVTEALLAASHSKLSYALAVDDDTTKDLNQLYADAATDPNVQQITQTFEQRANFDQDVKEGLMAATSELLTSLADPSSGLVGSLSSYWEARLPPGQQRSKWTIDQLITAMDDENFVQGLITAGEIPPPEELSWGQKILSTGVAGAKAIFQAGLHCAAIGLAALSLAEGSKTMSAVEIVQLSFSIAAEGLNIVGMAARKIIRWGIGRLRGWTRTIAWFFNAPAEGIETLGKRVASAFVGSMDKFVRLIGLVGCVVGIVSSFWDMESASAMSGPDGHNFYVYSMTQFVLGCVEGVLIIGDIIADCMITAGLLSWCGPLAIAVSVVELVVTLIYDFFFAPNPYQPVLDFLQNEGEQYGSYDPNQSAALIPTST